MAKFKTYSALVSAMNKNINIAVENACNRLLGTLQELIDTEYYDQFEPDFYIRSYQFWRSATTKMLTQNCGEIFMDEKAFSLRLAQLREKKGVSARDMSLSIGQNAGYINNIESGKSMPSLSGFFYICEYLGISPSDFFDVNTKNPARLNELMDDLKRLNDKQLETIAVLVKDIIK